MIARAGCGGVTPHARGRGVTPHAGGRGVKRWSRTARRMEQVTRLHAVGLSFREIARATGMSYRRVCTMALEAGLPRKAGRTDMDDCDLCPRAAPCRTSVRGFGACLCETGRESADLAD